MTLTSPSSLALAMAVAAGEVTLYLMLGEVVARLAARITLWRRLPELALWIGIATYSVLGTLTLAAGVPIRMLLPLSAGGCLAGLFAMRRRATSEPGLLAGYAGFRSSGWGAAAMLLLVSVAAATVSFRVPWLGGAQSSTEAAWGTRIYDDPRTVGNPLSLAAHGWPLRNPLAVETRLAYPPGSFAMPGSWMAWFPRDPLPVTAADGMVQSTAFGLAAAMAMGSVAKRPELALAGLAAALLAPSIDVNRLPVDRDSPWYREWFGYTHASGIDRTPAWSTYRGLFWISNHAGALGALLVLGLVFSWPGGRPLCYLFAAAAAISSLDMTVMGGLFAGMLLLWRRYRRQVLPLALFTGVVLIAVNWPVLSGPVDAPVANSFRLVEKPLWNLGALASTHGVMLILVIVLAWGAKMPPTLMAAATVPLMLSLLFRWQSIWFWRSAFALHTLLALAVVGMLGHRRRGALLLAGTLAAGLPHILFEASDELRNFPRVSAAQAEVYRYVAKQTSLRERTVEWRDADGVLASSVNLLRTGNRAGDPPFDRLLPVAGYRDYERRFRSITHGLLNNDLIVYWGDRPELAAVLRSCGAEVRFSNRAGAVFGMNSVCRAWLGHSNADAVLETSLRRKKEVLDRARKAGGATRLDDASLQRYLIEIPDDTMLRQRADAFWAGEKWDEAIAFLAPIVEARPTSGGHYCLAFSYQRSGRDPAQAIAHYTKALEQGFPEFWARYGRGGVYLVMGERMKAKADLERARELDSGHEGVRMFLRQLEAEAIPSRP